MRSWPLVAVATWLPLAGACADRPGKAAPPASYPDRVSPAPDAGARPAPPPAPPPSQPPLGAIGTPHPFVFRGADSHGRWVALCQARRDSDGDGTVQVRFGHHGDPIGDRLDVFLVTGDGDGEPVDELVAASESGHHVVVEREGRLELRDFARGTRTTLRQRERRPRHPLGASQAASFDGAGAQLLYARGDGTLALRRLSDGRERTIDPGKGHLWRATLDAGGEHVVAQVVVRDTDGDGAVELPAPRTTLSSDSCRGPALSWGFYGSDGDQPVVRVTELASGARRDVPEFLGIFAGELIERRRDGALTASRAGRQRVLIEPACRARVVHVEPRRLYFGCVARARKNAPGDVQLPLEYIEGGARRDAGIVIWAEDTDTWKSDDPVQRGPGDKAIVFATGTVGEVPLGFELAAWNDRIVKPAIDWADAPFGGRIPYVLDLGSGRRTRLSDDLEGVSANVSRGSLFAIPARGGRTKLLDLATLDSPGSVPGCAYAIAQSGHVLTGACQARGRAARGPLRWRLPGR
jgi:hypothetical protein